MQGLENRAAFWDPFCIALQGLLQGFSGGALVSIAGF